jgi:hypothetical protein
MSKPTPEPDVPIVAVDASTAAPTETRDELQRNIETAREQLGETVEALAHKVDVPARAKEKVQSTVQSVQAKAGELSGEATALTNKAVASLPPQARGPVEQLVAAIRQRPLPAALAAVGVLLVVVGLLRRGR